MKKILVLLFAAGRIFSQTVNISEYEPKDDLKRFKQVYVGQDKDYYYTTKLVKGTFKFEVFNELDVFKYDLKTLDLIANKKIKIKEEKKSELVFKKVIPINGKAYLFYSINYFKKKKVILYASSFNADMSSSNNISTIDSLSYEKDGYVGDFIVQLSDEADKILVLKQHHHLPELQHKFKCVVYDDVLKKVFENEIEIPYKGYYGYVKNIIRMNNEKLYMFLTSLSRLDDNSKDPKLENIIFIYDLKTNKLNHNSLDFSPSDSYSVKFEFDTKKRLNVIGLLSNPEKKEKYYIDIALKAELEGAFCITFNNMCDSIINKSVRAFSELTNYNQIKNSTNKYYTINSINLFSDNSFGIICEQYTTEAYNIGEAKSPIIQVGYWYGNLFAFNINTDEKNKWSKMFYKSQGCYKGETQNSLHSIIFLKGLSTLNFVVNVNKKLEDVKNNPSIGFYDFEGVNGNKQPGHGISSSIDCYTTKKGALNKTSKLFKIDNKGQVTIQDIADGTNYPIIYTSGRKISLGLDCIITQDLEELSKKVQKITFK